MLLLLSRSVFNRLSRSFIRDVSAVMSRLKFEDVSMATEFVGMCKKTGIEISAIHF